MDIKLIGTSVAGGVNLFWWIFWLIIFWPMLVIVCLVHFSNKQTIYHIQYKSITGKEVIERVTEQDYLKLINN